MHHYACTHTDMAIISVCVLVANRNLFKCKLQFVFTAPQNPTGNTSNGSLVFPGGLPSKYWPDSTLLSFSEQYFCFRFTVLIYQVLLLDRYSLTCMKIVGWLLAADAGNELHVAERASDKHVHSLTSQFNSCCIYLFYSYCFFICVLSSHCHSAARWKLLSWKHIPHMWPPTTKPVLSVYIFF